MNMDLILIALGFGLLLAGTWACLLNPCLLGHAPDPLYGRDEDGALCWTCARCQQQVAVVLASGEPITPMRFPTVRGIEGVGHEIDPEGD